MSVVAEALGITSSIAAVLQLTGSLISIGYKYISGVKDASNDLEQLLEELQSLEKILLLLRNHALEDKNLQLAGLQALNGQNGALSKCALDLRRLQLKLKPPIGGSKGLRGRIRSLRWPLKEKETFQHISRIERHKSLFKLVLAIDHLKLSKAIENCVQDTKVLMQTVLTQSTTEASRRYEMEVRKSTELRQTILNWISPEDFDRKHLEISGRRQKDTGKWIFANPIFKGWIAECPECRLLWGHGIPGAGKTFLSSSVVDYLFEQAPVANYGVGYIYFDYLGRDKQRPINVLASLIKQLAGQRLTLPIEIKELYENLESQKRHPTYENLYTALLQTSNTFDQVFLVFDALDECDQRNQRTELLPLLHCLANDGIRIFLTSRPHPEDIQISFQNVARIRILAKEEDLRIYVQQRISESPRAKRLVEKGNCEEKVISELADCSGGMFLLVHFHIEHICQQTTVRQILRELESLRTSSSSGKPLDPTYDRVMDSIRKQPEGSVELALKILSWLVKAKRALTIDELREAVSIEPGQRDLDEWNLADMLTLLDVCASFVTVDGENSTVRLAHYTIQEYLLRNHVLPENADLMLAMACTTYLSFDIFARESYKSYSERELLEARQKRYPFVRYAVQYMSVHLKACDEKLTIAMFLRLLQNPTSVDSYTMMTMGTTFDCYRGTLPLHLASAVGHFSVVQELLDSGANISADNHGWTALHEAANKGHEKVALLLLSSGIDISACNRHGQTALDLAAYNGHSRVVQLLLENGADVSTKDHYGWTALCRAACEGHEETVRVILEYGADISVTDFGGSTPLHMAASNGHKDVVKILLDKGADLSIRDHRRRKPGDTIKEILVEGAHRVLPGNSRGVKRLPPNDNNYNFFMGYRAVARVDCKMPKSRSDLEATLSLITEANGSRDLEVRRVWKVPRIRKGYRKL